MDMRLIAEWYKFADRDLAVAEHLDSTMYPKPLEIICFHCQQAAEKYLKGYLIFSGIDEPPKIHDLDVLVDMCLGFDSRFAGIKKACTVLTQYGVQPRYPEEIEISEYGTRKALEYARQIRGSLPLTELREKTASAAP